VEQPLVTVILTCFNHERYVLQALDAVEAQTHRPIELVVTDDASGDRSADLIAGWLDERWPGATFVRHDVNVGLTRTLNEALKHVSGEFVTITSADDWMEPVRLERLVAAFEAAPEDVGLVYSGIRLVDGDGVEIEVLHTEPGSAPSGWIFPQQLAIPRIPTPTVMVRAAVYDAVGGFTEGDVVEDYDMWLRVCRTFQVLHVPAALVNYRWHRNNTTTSLRREVYDGYVATCLRRQLGHSDETDDLIRRRLAQLERR
jgi:glycosyltransferase involved in cell wall biosynthesis